MGGDAETVSCTLSELRLSAAADLLMRQATAAEARKLEVAVALLGAPPLVLLDEPTRGLDLTSKHDMWAHMNTCMRAGSTMMLASTSVDEVEAVCQRVRQRDSFPSGRRNPLLVLGEGHTLRNRYAT